MTCSHGGIPDCVVCARIAAHAQRIAADKPVPPRPECIHLGLPTDRRDAAGTPCGCDAKWLYTCDIYGQCTRGVARSGVPCCATCGHWADGRLGPADPIAVERPLASAPPMIRFDEKNLFPEVPGLRFNSSLIEYRDGYALAFRTGWRGSEIYVATLGPDFTPLTCTKLDLRHSAAGWGREDPRLFWYRGQLHVMFIGVIGRNGPTNVLYARLDGRFNVEAIHHPHYPARNSWEKNWQCFEHDGELFAVYSVAPHRVLRIAGDSAELAYETGTPAPWGPATEMRGGASPVRVGDEWYSFFHSRDANRVYNCGLYCFEARPPFRVSRIIPEPILVADPSTRPGDQYTPVVFPCGAVRRGSKWIVSMGVHDRWTELRAFDAVELERRLVRIAPPAAWSCEPWPAIDRDIFADVVRRNEYRLPESFAPGDRVIDCGAHVGSFAHAVWLRGSRCVDCFEPSPANLVHLRANAADMPGVSVHSAAVGGGLLCWHPPADSSNTGGGTCAPREITELQNCVIGVESRPLDDIIGTGRVAFLKLDIEGGEWGALTNATRLGQVDRIALEWHPPRDPETLADILRQAGFVVELVPTTDGRGMMFGRRD